MKKRSEKLLWWLVIIIAFLFSTAFRLVGDISVTGHSSYQHETNDGLKLAAFEVLDTKCNVCHRRQNPFRVFSLKNMEKHASKIYKQVIVKRRMPKGDIIRLTNEEFLVLEKWLLTQNLN